MSAPAGTRHVPMRRCVVCRASRPRAELLRLVRIDEGYRLDPARRLGGRGTWVCAGCATEPNDKRLRQAFAGQAQEVRALLHAAVSALPQAAASALPEPASAHASPAAQGAAGNPASEA
ncbi:MAG: DUF448 domain-containing protein [Trueperaceae bacterium]|nr:DUF448 domain-containing protein [Trueperaceae bacterium]